MTYIGDTKELNTKSRNTIVIGRSRETHTTAAAAVAVAVQVAAVVVVWHRWRVVVAIVAAVRRVKEQWWGRRLPCSTVKILETASVHREGKEWPCPKNACCCCCSFLKVTFREESALADVEELCAYKLKTAHYLIYIACGHVMANSA